MSHHLDSPQSRQDVRLDICDLYVFRGETGTVFVMDVCNSIAGQEEQGFHAEALYEFKLDLDGDAVEDLAYRFAFGPLTASHHQDWTLRLLTGDEARDPYASGTIVAQEGTTLAEERVHAVTSGGLRVWAGRAGDPFWIDPVVLDAVGRAFHEGTRVDLSGWVPVTATNRFAGQTVFSIVLEVPDAELAPYAAPGTPVGVWGLTTLATDAGGWRQINRAGLPMIHPIFAQFDDRLADHLNAGGPARDRQSHGKVFADMVAGVVRANGTCGDPQSYGERVADAVLPNMLPYRLGTPASFGFAGWNGRWLTDNVPEVMFSFASNLPISMGVTRESTTAKPSRTFPYVPVLA